MNELSPPVVSSQPSATRMSLGARLMNIFTGPGEVFEQVKRGPASPANWLVPSLLSCVAGVVAAVVVLSQEPIMHQIREQQENTLRRSTARLPKEQQEKAIELAEKIFNPTVLKILRAGGAVAGTFSWLLLMALGLWVLGTRVFKGTFRYMQALEVCGLAGMISVLGIIVSMLLAVIMGNLLATPGPALLVKDLDATNPAHLILSSFHLANFWYLGVLAIGLARLSGASVLRSGIWLFSFWMLATVALVFLTTAAQRLFS
jgi:mannitol-specific phosphotransferase system IIBC component